MAILDDRDMSTSSNNDPSFLIKFFWLCSGANLTVLKKAPLDHNKYASIGFSIVLISVLAGISGGYALWTVFNEILISCFGGAFWGVILGTMDRFVVSSVTKSEDSGWKEKLGGTVFFLLRLSISIIISLVVAKPLELKLFEPSINKKLDDITKEEILVSRKTLNDEYNSRIKQLREEKQEKQNEINTLRFQLDEAQKNYSKELREGGNGRPRGDGPIAARLRELRDRAQNNYDDEKNRLRSSLDIIEDKIANLQNENNDKLERETKDIKTIRPDGFVARLSALHDIQKEEDKIVMGMGIYGITGWLISIVFILIDTTAIIIKLFTPISVYDELLETERKGQSDLLKAINKKRYDTEKEIQVGKASFEQSLISERMKNKKKFIQGYLDQNKKFSDKINDDFQTDMEVNMKIEELIRKMKEQHLKYLDEDFENLVVIYEKSLTFKKDNFTNNSNHKKNKYPKHANS